MSRLAKAEEFWRSFAGVDDKGSKKPIKAAFSALHQVLGGMVAVSEDGDEARTLREVEKTCVLVKAWNQFHEGHVSTQGDLELDYAVDSNPHKQGLVLPGSRIPIKSPDTVDRTRPDYLVILPWNLRDEVMTQMAHIRSWGGRFVVPGPNLEVLE